MTENDEPRYETYFPVALKLRGRKVVVVGGGREAARKVRAILPCGAELVVISADAEPEIAELARSGRLTHLARAYREGDLEGAFLAIVCDAAIGPAVRDEAARRGVLLNVLDESELCDFIAMATVLRDGLQLAVHSSGKSAALTRTIRRRLDAEFGPVYGDLVRLLGELRPLVHGMIPTPERRRAFWLDLVTPELLARVEAGLPIEDLRGEILSRAAGWTS